MHSCALVQAAKAPLGQSPWPTDGWLVLLGEGTTLRPGALQAVERWLTGAFPSQSEAQSSLGLRSLGQSTLMQPDLIYADEDRLNADGNALAWLSQVGRRRALEQSLAHASSIWRISWLRDRQLPIPPEDSEGRWRWQLLALKDAEDLASPSGACPCWVFARFLLNL